MNLFDAYWANPSDASSYPNWIDNQIWALLQQDAIIREEAGGVRVRTPVIPLHVALTSVIERSSRWHHRWSVELLDGTVIRSSS